MFVDGTNKFFWILIASIGLFFFIVWADSEIDRLAPQIRHRPEISGE